MLTASMSCERRGSVLLDACSSKVPEAVWYMSFQSVVWATRGVRDAFQWVHEVKTIFVIILRCPSPFSLLFSHWHTVKFAGGHTVRDDVTALKTTGTCAVCPWASKTSQF